MECVTHKDNFSDYASIDRFPRTPTPETSLVNFSKLIFWNYTYKYVSLVADVPVGIDRVIKTMVMFSGPLRKSLDTFPLVFSGHFVHENWQFV